MSAPSYRFCIAPMMDGTDRHCRYFHRLISKRARLYTEMIVAESVVRGDRDRLLGFAPCERPVALQIGGADPQALAEAARMGAEYGYDEINLNVGCPSDRVQSGLFGACLMKTPALVADCVREMIAVVNIPVTVKCRIGVDDQDPEESLFRFVELVSEAGCKIFIVHARKAWLKGLSPKENRNIPPLNYALVETLKEAHPELIIVINGGVTSIRQTQELLQLFDGVMVGRTAYADPFFLSSVDVEIFNDPETHISRTEVVRQMSTYLKNQFRQGVRPHAITRHMLGLYHGVSGARRWRRFLSESASEMRDDVLDRALGVVNCMKAFA